MGRIKIQLPEKFIFTTTLTVRIDDLNYGRHLANDRVLALAHEARIQFLKSLQYTELNLAGTGLIMSDAAISFKAEAFQGNELIIEIGVTDLSKFGFDLIYKITDKEAKHEVAIVKTGMICFNYEKKKMTLLPTEAKEKLNG
jgi:acyl-CoA thioester hydrolase